MKETILEILKKVLNELGADVEIQLDVPVEVSHGDYSTNFALILAKKLNKNPREVAEQLKERLVNQGLASSSFEKIEVAGAGFINFFIAEKKLIENLQEVAEKKETFGTSEKNKGKKVMVEYAHPNTHKEMHIGHMRTLITGESLARLFQATGATVFRANYQGDIGPHVAKALFGLRKLMEEENLTIDEISKLPHAEKAHILGRGYARGSKDYETFKDEIDEINKKLYEKTDNALNHLYSITRQWSLDYYEDFYHDFYTRFDKLFFESEMADHGKEIVTKNVGKVFEKDDGAIIFPGKQYGLHNRVFITSKGIPTYEGKEMANAEAEYNAFHFDKKIHVVGSEQVGYFKVVFKALELLDPEKYKNKQFHVSMGMVQFTDRKMSSRTGDVLRVDWLIDEVRKKVAEIVKIAKVNKSATDEVTKQITIGAIKYSVLKVNTNQDVAFDINQSVSLEGNSGPYLQYTYARTRSVLSKAQVSSIKYQVLSINLEKEEEALLRLLIHFQEVVEKAAENFMPSAVCTYLFDLSQKFNLFYQKHSILSPVIASESEAISDNDHKIATSSSTPRNDNEDDIRQFRLALTSAVGQTLKNGLNLLGVQAPEKM